MALNTISFKDTGVLPPSIVGNIDIELKVGETINLGVGSVMNSNPPFMQEQGYAVGGISLSSTGIFEEFKKCFNTVASARIVDINRGDNNQLLVGSTLNSVTPISGGEFTPVAFQSGINFTGRAIGVSRVFYIANARGGASGNVISQYGGSVGVINIKVVAVPTNQPPSAILGQTIPVFIGSLTPLQDMHFSNGYQHPQNMPWVAIRITILPTIGQLMYNMQQVTPTMLPLTIPRTDINMGKLLYNCPTNATPNGTTPFTFGVASTINGTYKF